MFKYISVFDLEKINIKDYVIVRVSNNSVELRDRFTEKYLKTKIESLVKEELKELIRKTRLQDVDTIHKTYEYVFKDVKEFQIEYFEELVDTYSNDIFWEYGKDFDIPSDISSNIYTTKDLLYELIREDLIRYIFANNKQWAEEVLNDIKETL